MWFNDCRYTQIIHIHVPSYQVASWENDTLLEGGVRVRVRVGINKRRLKASDGNL